VTIRHFAQIVGRGLPLDGGVGRDDQLLDPGPGQSILEQVEPQIIRPDTIQRRQLSEEHEIASAELGGLLDRQDIGRAFNGADYRGITPIVATDATVGFGGEVATLPAAADLLHGLLKGPRQSRSTVAITLEELKGHALGRPCSDARKTAQRFEELVEGIKRQGEASL